MSNQMSKEVRITIDGNVEFCTTETPETALVCITSTNNGDTAKTEVKCFNISMLLLETSVESLINTFAKAGLDNMKDSGMPTKLIKVLIAKKVAQAASSALGNVFNEPEPDTTDKH